MDNAGPFLGGALCRRRCVENFETNLSNRAKNALAKAGIVYVEEIPSVPVLREAGYGSHYREGD
jgi:hypothetical protein